MTLISAILLNSANKIDTNEVVGQ